MRQVIVRLRDCRATNYKTLKVEHYFYASQYKSLVFEHFKDLMPGQEIYVKVGNKYSTWITYEEAENAVNSGECSSIEEYIHSRLFEDYLVHYYIENYLLHY